jgi:hypothetical protein
VNAFSTTHREVRNDIASIRAELNKLTAQQAHTIRGRAEYNANLLKMKQLREILNQHNTDLKYTSRTWGSLASFAGKLEHYQTLIFGVVAAFTGLVAAAKSATQAYAEFDDKVADVMKTTGMSKEQAPELSDALKTIDTRTSQNELLELARIAGKLGITGKDDLLQLKLILKCLSLFCIVYKAIAMNLDYHFFIFLNSGERTRCANEKQESP